jgi:tRNA modification GTPase
MIVDDTIAAVSSAVGQAARMIVRLSGPAALGLSQHIGVPFDMRGGSALRCRLMFGGVAVSSWVYVFHTPRSYTGQDLVEFHLPGSPVLVKMLLEHLLKAGARLAEPGEFTARAWFNGRMSLTDAEGVAATIAAGSEQELTAARQLMAGELARRLEPVMESLADTLALLEVGIDFSEEDVTFLSIAQVRHRVGQADAALLGILRDSTLIESLAHEPRVVLTGRPNAGKSTLLNALAGSERAVVSPIAGTTRDALSARVALPRGYIQVVDVAGLEELSEPLDDPSEIDQKMRRHALRELEAADVIVWVEDSSDPRPRLQQAGNAKLVVRSKSDLAQGMVQCNRAELFVTAITGAGMGELKRRLDALCFGESGFGTALALNRRHLQAIEQARAALSRLLEELPKFQGEFLALELREVLDALGGVLGQVTPDDVLGRIFAGFCIGK